VNRPPLVRTARPADLETYLRLFAPYENQLHDFSGPEREFGGRFALLFRQVLRLLVLPTELNRSMPRLFIEVAHQYLGKNPETLRHFSYEENRHFFLSDLLDWLQIYERGRRMRRMGENQR